MFAGTLAQTAARTSRFLLRRPVSRATDLASGNIVVLLTDHIRDRMRVRCTVKDSYRSGIVRRHLATVDVERCSGTQSHVERVRTIASPGFSSAFNLGRSFRFRLGSR